MTHATKTAAPPRAAAATRDAIAMLRADHQAVSALFAHYEKTNLPSKKKSIVDRICAALGVHAQIEEEIFIRPSRRR